MCSPLSPPTHPNHILLHLRFGGLGGGQSKSKVRASPVRCLRHCSYPPRPVRDERGPRRCPRRAQDCIGLDIECGRWCEYSHRWHWSLPCIHHTRAHARAQTHTHTPACTHTHIHTRTHTGIGCLRTRRHIGDFRVLWRSLPIKKFVEIYFENPETSGNRCEVLSLSLSLFVTGHAQRRDGFLSPLTNERSPLLSSLV